MIDIQPGDNIAWKGGGPVFGVLSFCLSLFDSSWRKRTWKPWHTGIVLRVLHGDSIVTLQSVANGVQVVTYDSIEDMGDFRIFRWLNAPAHWELEDWAENHMRWGYDIFGYVTTIAGTLSMIIFKHPFRVVDRHMFCWECTAEADRYFGRELQPECEPVLISKMMTAWEGTHGTD